MKSSILASLADPAGLEQLYRSDRSAFERAFGELYPGIEQQPAAGFWNARLSVRDKQAVHANDLILLTLCCLLAGSVSIIPFIFHLRGDEFYLRNIGFILFPFLSGWFAVKRKLATSKTIGLIAFVLLAALFINAIPGTAESDTTSMACIHLLLVLWFMFGFAYAGGEWKNKDRWLAFLKFNGDLAVITGLILAVGGVVTALTVNLFRVIGFDPENGFFEMALAFILPSAPLIGCYLAVTRPQVMGQISTVLARIFAPVVLTLLSFYLVALVFNAGTPFHDRDSLIILNGVLIGVMALILFNITGLENSGRQRLHTRILFGLSAVTVAVGAIALTAISLRISEGGLTPNRVAVMGLNVLVLINLVVVSIQLGRVSTGKTPISIVGRTIVSYLPVYLAWALLIAVGFPLGSGFH